MTTNGTEETYDVVDPRRRPRRACPGAAAPARASRTRSILVVEKREGAAPEAAFKVGESSVEIGAHYFGEASG